MKTKRTSHSSPRLLLAGFHASGQSPPTPLDRTVLPIPEPAVKPITTLDARDAKAPPRFEVKAPAGAPNVVIVLIDDIGFGHSSAFGGPIKMPTLEKLAQRRAALQSLSHHRAVQPDAHGFAHRAQPSRRTMPARSWNWPRLSPATPAFARSEISTLAEILRQNGYSTGAFGKYHETPPWEVSVSGPIDRWPTGSGFDKFYGFIGGETNQWAPAIFDGVARAEPVLTPDLPLHRRHDRTTRSTGSAPSNRSRRTSRSTCISPPARRTPRITCRRNGSTNTKASSTAAGTSCARKPSSGRRRWASSRRTPSSPRGPRKFPPGTT